MDLSLLHVYKMNIEMCNSWRQFYQDYIFFMYQWWVLITMLIAEALVAEDVSHRWWLCYHWYCYYNQYQVFILPKHVLASLYLPSFNQRFYQSCLGQPFCHVTGTWVSDEEVNLSHEIPFSCYYKSAEIEHICIAKYICESIKGLWYFHPSPQKI